MRILGTMPRTDSSLPLPDGLTARAVSYGDGVDPDDLDLVTDLVHRLETGYLGRTESTRAELGEQLAGPLVRREHTTLVLDGGVGVGAHWIEYDEAGRELFLEVYVLPGRDALREAMIDHLVDVADRLVGDREGWVLRAGALQEETDHAVLLGSRGFVPVRRFWRMYVPSDSPEIPERPPSLPVDLTIEQAVSAEDREAVWRVQQEAFADHWNHVPRSYDQFWSHIAGAAGAGPANWWLLRVDGEPAAVCLLDDSRADVGESYVHVLGVRREFRGRGLARLLLRRAFVAARDAGRAGTSLHVDSQNPTGATRLYESVGMVPVQVMDAFERRR